MRIDRSGAATRWLLGPIASVALCACSGRLAEVESRPPSDATAEPRPLGDATAEPGALGPTATGGAPDSEAGTPPKGTSGSEAGGAAPSAGTPNTPASGAGTAGEASAPVSACANAPIDPGPAPLRLLTRAQYSNTLRDLFGSVPDLDSVLTRNAGTLAIGAGQGDVSQVELEDYQRAAETIAAAAVEGNALDSLAPCASGKDPRECARDFVIAFGARAYRAPLTEIDDIERHVTLFDSGAVTDYRHGIELLLRGMLQSVRFLYRVELGTAERLGDAAVPLSGFEVAARLSYTFWDSPPDRELTEAAANGALSSRQEIAEAAARLLADPRGKTAPRRFLEALIQLGALETTVKDAAMFPEWRQNDLPASMTAQARLFFDHVLGEHQGKLSSLLTADDFEPLDLPEDRAAGLLTLPALLSLTSKPNESSPIYRGKFVREMLLCQVPPSAPPDIPSAPEVEPGVSTRERLRQHQVDPTCSGCHALLDPIGFGFEHYDAIGRYRDSDGGKPIDARGEIIGTRELDGSFDGVRELASRLASSEQVRECVARQYFRFTLGRYEAASDACSVERLVTTFRDADADLNTLPAAFVATDAFAYRRPIDSP